MLTVAYSADAGRLPSWMALLGSVSPCKSAIDEGPALRLDPLQESVHRTLIGLYAQRGQYGAALRQYELCITLLARELRVPPSPETVGLWRRIAMNRASASVAAALEMGAEVGGASPQPPLPLLEPRSPRVRHDGPLSREHWHRRKPPG